MAKVSILMNGYNAEKYLKEAIDSVYSQTYTNWEIIFIDNCSNDHTKDIIDKYDDKIKYYKTPSNINLCNARVFAKDFIQGEFFCVLDTDDLWMPSKLEKQVSLMNKYEDIGIIYTNTVYFTDSGNEIIAYDKMMPKGNLFGQLLSNYFFSFETVMVRKKIMDEHNIYFDSKYNVSSDAEFFIKLSYFTKCLYIDEPLARWRYGNGSESEKNLCSFPYEYELLLSDLSNLIENFEKKYKDEIESLRNKINNMYGICYWNKSELQKARKYFKKSIKNEKKYYIPYIMSFVISYKTYKNIRKKLTRI